MVRDPVVFSIYYPQVGEKLLNQGAELILEKAADIARSHEIAQAQMKSMASGSTNAEQEQQVHSIRKHAKIRQSRQNNTNTYNVLQSLLQLPEQEQCVKCFYFSS